MFQVYVAQRRAGILKTVSQGERAATVDRRAVEGDDRDRACAAGGEDDSRAGDDRRGDRGRACADRRAGEDRRDDRRVVEVDRAVRASPKQVPEDHQAVWQPTDFRTPHKPGRSLDTGRESRSIRMESPSRGPSHDGHVPRHGPGFRSHEAICHRKTSRELPSGP